MAPLIDDTAKMAEDKVAHVEQGNTPRASIVAGEDKAAKVFKQSGRTVALTHENNKRVLRQIDLRILPVILGIYFLQALDKATLAYASVFGLVKDTHLVGHQYSWYFALKSLRDTKSDHYQARSYRVSRTACCAASNCVFPCQVSSGQIHGCDDFVLGYFPYLHDSSSQLLWSSCEPPVSGPI